MSSNIPAQSSARVLIVDRSPENREVLRTALEHRGWTTVDADRFEEGVELARRYRPELVVLDLDSAPESSEAVCEEFDDPARCHPPWIVVLGKARRPGQPTPPNRQFVAKPYHYAPLIRTIEGFLQPEVVDGNG